MCLLWVSMMNNQSHLGVQNPPKPPFKPNTRKIQIAISSDLCIRLTWNLTGSCSQQETSYGGKIIPRWWTAAILKIVISPYLSEKSSDFQEILYTAAEFELGERHVIKNEKVALDRFRVRQIPAFNITYFLYNYIFSYSWIVCCLAASCSNINLIYWLAYAICERNKSEWQAVTGLALFL